MLGIKPAACSGGDVACQVTATFILCGKKTVKIDLLMIDPVIKYVKALTIRQTSVHLHFCTYLRQRSSSSPSLDTGMIADLCKSFGIRLWRVNILRPQGQSWSLSSLCLLPDVEEEGLEGWIAVDWLKYPGTPPPLHFILP